MEQLKQFQKDLYEWQHTNFGKESAFWLAVGVAEEVGEMMHCFLKRHQGIREFAYDSDEGNKLLADALGDILVYGLNLGTTLEISIESFFPTEPPDVTGPIIFEQILASLLKASGGLMSLVHVRESASVDNELFMSYLSIIFRDVQSVCFIEGISFMDNFMSTVNGVMKRDWNQNKIDGGDSDRGSNNEETTEKS